MPESRPRRDPGPWLLAAGALAVIVLGAVFKVRVVVAGGKYLIAVLVLLLIAWFIGRALRRGDPTQTAPDSAGPAVPALAATPAIAPPLPPWRSWLGRRAVTLTVLLAACTLLSFAAAWWWIADLITHFTAHLAVAALLACLGAVQARRWWTSAAVGALACYGLVQVLAVYGPAIPPDAVEPPAHAPHASSAQSGWNALSAHGPSNVLSASSTQSPATAASLRLVTANVELHHPDPDHLLHWIRDTDPDLVVLLEVTPRIGEAAERCFGQSHPFRVIAARDDAFGIAVFSRHRAHCAIVDLTNAIPTALADCELAGVPITVIAAHPPPPIRAGLAALRNAEFAALAERIRSSANSPRTILAGDLNCTPWSPHFATLLAHTGLRDSRQGFGHHPTWPAGLGPLGIPIDHVLIGPAIAVTHRRISPRLGSDHRAVVVELVVK